MSRPILELHAISKSFGKIRAVEGLCFSMKAGQVCGFIGPNGAGKTTTMRILATLDLPDAGTASIDGLDILVEPRAVRQRTGFMADRFLAYPNLSVEEFLDFFARAYGLRGRERRRRVEAVSSFCGLDALRDRLANQLSKGMAQRLHLAKTLIHDPALLVLDEPAAGLDPRARIEFRELVRELAAAGKGVFLSSHILSELGEICDAVLIIEKGKMVASGGVAEIAKTIHHLSPVRVSIVGDLAPAERFFLVQPQVESVSATDGVVRFSFSGDDRDMALLLKRAVEAGLLIAEFQRTRAGLEDIFMETTKGELA